MERLLQQWRSLTKQGIKIIGLSCLNVDRSFVFRSFWQQAQLFQTSCYYYNKGYKHIQQLYCEESFYRFVPTGQAFDPASREQFSSGLYLIDDFANFKDLDPVEQGYREAVLQNLLDLISLQDHVFIILLSSYFSFSQRISAEIPILELSLPDVSQVKSLVMSYLAPRRMGLADEINQQRLVNICCGLPRGEIQLALNTNGALAQDFPDLIHLMLSYKLRSLRQLGLEFISDPDVMEAGGLDLLQEFLTNRVAKLNEPGAVRYGLRPPKGMILLGPPGTGKSLSAKLAAKALGYPLLGLSWGNVLGSDNPDYTLARILEVADTLDRCVLLADDFDKGFTGWESGGASRRLSQRLLTWMQERTSHVFMIATVNRIQLLPSEIKRRFDDGGIWFVDLPHLGALYHVFQLHLRKYFSTQFQHGDPWNEDVWYKILQGYKGCTPVEIANAVMRCAAQFYCELGKEERSSASIEPVITPEQLLDQLTQFQKASIRDEADLQAIRNTAYYARPASSSDHSIFAAPNSELFDYACVK
ncbi:ATPase [Chroococcus sp. FPU101]|nr:ATPase [Chroococcus sp. FPU101]